jgi:sugar phosphate isomerase/epimerase
MMLQLLNFSVYSVHTSLFDDDWRAVADFVTALGLDGIELLIAEQQPLPELPPGLLGGIHLPYWIRWLDVWQQGAAAPISADERCFLAGDAGDAGHMVELQYALWQQAARLQPRYAVFHISHVTMEHTFNRAFTYSAAEVVAATADLLNAVAARFPGGEPPVRLWLENLWWPGLTFADPALAAELAARLRFDNWGFVLDTGHLVNTDPAIADEAAAIDMILAHIERLSPAVRRRIQGLHLNLSLSGEYQRRTIAAGVPAGFAERSFAEQYVLARDHVGCIDQHRPFCDPRCREIIAALDPAIVIHEFPVLSREDLRDRVETQRAAIGS